MDRQRLGRLFDPLSIAFVGGRRARLGYAQSARLGFAGQMWLVNPTDGGAYRSLHDLRDVPDVVFVGVAADTAIDVVAEAAALGVGGAVAYASGFDEIGRFDRRTALLEAAGDMPVLGPNCHGYVNALTGAAPWPDVTGCVPVEHGVALVSQSGNIAINVTMQRRGLALTHVITLGNQLAVSAAECIGYLAGDERVAAIGVYLEGIADSPGFAEAALMASSRGVPLVALAAGGSQNGTALVRTHTAAIAGPRAARSALFARYGVTEVETPEQLVAALSLLSHGGRLDGLDAVSLSSSGGEAALIADLSESTPIVFAPFSDETARKLSQVLGGWVTVSNPLDYHTYIWGDRDKMTECFSLAVDEHDVAMLILDWPAPGIEDTDWWPTLDAFTDAVAATGVRGVVATTITDNLPAVVADVLTTRGIAVAPGLEHALGAIEAARPVTVATELHAVGPPDPVRVPVDESEAKERLRTFGLPVPRGRATNRGGLRAAVEDVGVPAVLKTLGVAHKSEAGGVAVDLASVDAVEAAAAAMAHLGDRYLVEQFVDGVVAELLVGVASDHPAGWTLTVGWGGTMAELIADSVTLLLPVADGQIEHAIGRLAVAALLGGFRDGPRADLPAAVTVIGVLAAHAVETRTEIEVNPLLVCKTGVWIADVLMVELRDGDE